MNYISLVLQTMSDDKLSKLRKEIDGIDSEMLELLAKRLTVVKKVGEVKAADKSDGRSIIRPGREASMIRKVASFKPKIEVDNFPNATAAYIWRLIIACAITIEEETKISVNAGPMTKDYYWLAREYFGPFTDYITRDSSTEVIRDLVGGNATVGVVLLNENDASQAWWTRLTKAESHLKVFARLPFVKTYTSTRPALVAIGNVLPENTGDDTSLWVISAEEHIQAHDIVNTMESYGLKGKMLHCVRTFGVPNIHEHLCTMEGFVTAGDERMHTALQAINSTVRVQQNKVSGTYIGSYANPILIPNIKHET
jgi:chorismate mutase / prephenate dehydratase